MSIDPYTEPEKPDAFGRAQTVLGVISSSLTGLIGAAFIVVGIGILGVAALIAALVTRESYFLPLGLTALAIGAIRFFLGRRR